MAPSPTPIPPGRKRLGGARSVSGCLTCRRRRVKCTVQTAPCPNCRRLGLACNASFHGNFKSWTPQKVSQELRQADEIPDRDSLFERSGETNEVDYGQFASRAATDDSEIPQDVLLWLSDGLGHGQFDTPTALSLPSGPDLRDTWGTSQIDSVQYEDHAADYRQTPDQNALGSERRTDDLSGMNPDSVISVSPASPRVGMSDRYSDDCTLQTVALTSFDPNGNWALPPQVPQVYGNSHGTMPLLSTFETAMPTLLTSKASPWNPYNFMASSTLLSPSSPLRHGILSWTCSYLSIESSSPFSQGAAYYVSASSSTHTLVSELMIEHQNDLSMKLYMLLSTAFFLSHCDLMLCDYASFQTRLESIKNLFYHRWNTLGPHLGSLERRLLIWLAYLDLRSSLFGTRKALSASSSSSSNRKNLLDVLSDLNALKSLRAVTSGRSYLSDCFGDAYPAEEVREDLVQEPCHVRCDDILLILSKISEFDQWNHEHRQSVEADSTMQELRAAKIEAFQANIARVRAVSHSYISTVMSHD